MANTPAAHTAVTSDEFTYDQALLILRCRDCYAHNVIHRAALWMLGCMDAEDDDIRLAAALLAG